MYESDAVTITYADFLLLTHIDDATEAAKGWAPGLRVDADGVWVSTEATSPFLTDEERRELMQHPDGDTRKPLVSFPTSLGALRTRLLPTMGGGWIGAFELADIVFAWQPHVPTKWPWGNHETRLLRALEAAGKHFWGEQYDPTNPHKAATNDKVCDWLVETKAVPSPRAGRFVAQILHADGLKPGPR